MENSGQDIVIFGSSEIAIMAKFYFDHDSKYKVTAFTVDDGYANMEKLNGIPLVPFSRITDLYPPDRYPMHVALSYHKMNRFREEKYHQAKAAGYRLVSYVCSRSVTWSDLAIGDNCFILENQTIQPEVTIGSNVVIWSGNHIGHGTHIDDHTYIASHVVVSGHCRIGKRCFLGVNATIRDFITIGDDCFITMGAPVIKDLKAKSVMLAAKGEMLESGNPKGETLRNKYFRFGDRS